MKNFEFYQKDELDSQTIESLKAQDVDLDQYDYLIFVEEENLQDFFDLEVKHRKLRDIFVTIYFSHWVFVFDFNGRKGLLGIGEILN